ncbi:MAG: signal peptidase I [Oscillospiraceae bacterium]|nr:signal peptidase I [Oscillospiraceae bacterium]
MVKTIDDINREFEIEYLFGSMDNSAINPQEWDDLIPEMLGSMPEALLSELEEEFCAGAQAQAHAQTQTQAQAQAQDAMPPAPQAASDQPAIFDEPATIDASLASFEASLLFDGPAIPGETADPGGLAPLDEPLRLEGLDALDDPLFFEALLQEGLVPAPDQEPGTKKADASQPDKPAKKKRSISRFISNALFFFAIVSILLAALSFSFSGNGAKRFLGYSFMTVLTSSMEPEISRGALVITKEVDEQDIKDGDDITFLDLNADRVVTHRVVEIQENYQDSGKKAFVTQGIANENPDREPVFHRNIVGSVVATVPGLGDTLQYVSDRKVMFFILFGLIILASISIQWYFDVRARERVADKKATVGYMEASPAS